MTAHGARPDPPAPPPLSARVVTERLILRAPRTEDVAALRLVLRKNSAHLQPWSVTPAPGEDPASLTSVSRSVLRYRKEWKQGQAYVLLITPRGNEREILGRVALGGIQRGAFLNAHLGYWIDAAHEGQGLMTEAVREATAFAFAALGLHRVQAAVMPRNQASHRVLEKVGYRREGMALRYLFIAGAWEDHVLYALTREDSPPPAATR
ncbi:MAG: GNAT family N-acetyltransferase [Polyangiaceae bacterium]